MLKTQTLVDKICTKISGGGLTDLETCQTTNALIFLNAPVFSVSTKSALPDAIQFDGRLVYVNDENRYYHSVQGVWTSSLTGAAEVFANVAFGWGANSSGQLGDGTTVSKLSPVSVVGGFTDWCQISGGRFFTMGLRPNGTLWAWGSNSNGQLGTGTTVSTSSPVSVVGGFTDWRQVSASSFHVAALRRDGTIWTWGNNSNGQLGTGTTVSTSSPVSVVGGFTDWCQVSAGQYHTTAIRQNGTLWGWGRNACGQLGDGTTLNRSSPVSVIGGFTDWCQTSAGGAHSLAVRQNGTLWTWGLNGNGRLGDGTTLNRSSPVSVVGGFTDWCQVSAGCNHTLAVRQTGTLWAWGSNLNGQLGTNSTVSASSPVSVIGGFTDWCQVSAGSRYHTIGVRTNGTAWVWGAALGGGFLGDGTSLTRSSPVPIIGGFTDWCQVSAGYQSTAGIRAFRKGI